MSRQHFEATGKLSPCPNPRHEFSVGRLIWQWRWAKESWCHMNDRGNLVTTFAGITTTETPEGLKLLTLTLWRLCVMFGLKVGADGTTPEGHNARLSGPQRPAQEVEDGTE